MITLTLWIFQAIYFLSVYVYWIQTKEYRIDKLVDFVKSGQAIRKLFLPILFAKIILLLILHFVSSVTWIIPYVFGAIVIYVLYRLLSFGITRPILTLRAILIIFGSLFILSLSVLIRAPFVLLELLLITSPVLLMLITDIPVIIVKNRIIECAKEKLENINPTIIAITGSYGKTTTKEFIYQLLSSSYNTVATEGSQNTPIGIARKILRDIKPGVKFFIVEMGAYKQGEINRLCDIARPDISVLTGIDTQHVSLFGSFENLKNAKYEIVQNLDKNGLAIFNTNNSEINEFIEKAKKSKIEFAEYTSGKKVPVNGITVLSASENIKGLTVNVKIKHDKGIVQTAIHGKHFAENLACAIYIARLNKIPWTEIKRICRNLKLPQKTMNFIPTGLGSVIIDDSFNSTPTAFVSALHSLSSFKTKKAIITPGLLELGKYTEREHVKIGKLLSNRYDKIILTNREFASYIKEGIGNSKKPALVVNENTNDIHKIAIDLIKSGYTILLEGRVSVDAKSLAERRII